MGVILTTTAGLSIWIVLWALGIKGFDGILIAAGMVVIAVGVSNLIPYLPGRRS
jgi:hypothetical protein